MANLAESPEWVDEIYQIDREDDVEGGPDGPVNIQGRGLACRTQWLKQRFTGKALGVDIQKWLARFHYTEQDALVRAQATVDIQTGGLGVVDGVPLAEGDSILLTEQTEKTENGLYTASAGTWSRMTGYDAHDGQAFDFRYIFVKNGTDAGKLYAIDTKEYEIGQSELAFNETAFSPAALPGKIVIRDRAGKFEGGSGFDFEVWNVRNAAKINPGTGIGGITWNDPSPPVFDHIGIFENGQKIAQIDPGTQRYEPEEGIHRFTIKVVFADGRTSKGVDIEETAYFYSYNANLLSAVIPWNEADKLILTFDNFIQADSAEGISIDGIVDEITYVSQPDNASVPPSSCALPQNCFKRTLLNVSSMGAYPTLR